MICDDSGEALAPLRDETFWRNIRRLSADDGCHPAVLPRRSVCTNRHSRHKPSIGSCGDMITRQTVIWTFRAMTKIRTGLVCLSLATTCLFGIVTPDTVSAEEKPVVGIAMPTKSSARWIADGNNIVKTLQSRGYRTDLQYADDDIPNQVSQVENMVAKGDKVLVIAAIDGTTLSDTLHKAAQRGVKVVAYDRLIRNSPDVSNYATFDNFQVGVLQASSLTKALGLPEAKGPFNIELFGGSPDDNNAYFFFNGAMSVLKPYLDSGKLVIPSGQKTMEKVSTLRWDGSTAQARMDNLLSAYYTDRHLDAVLSPYDGISIGIISSLKGVGYGSGDTKMAYVSGQDCEIPSVKSIMAGDQYSSIFKDTRKLAAVTADMVDAMLAGKTVPVNDTKSYNNGVKIVPAYLLTPVVVTKTNIRPTLIDSGYYTASQIE